MGLKDKLRAKLDTFSDDTIREVDAAFIDGEVEVAPKQPKIKLPKPPKPEKERKLKGHKRNPDRSRKPEPEEEPVQDVVALEDFGTGHGEEHSDFYEDVYEGNVEETDEEESSFASNITDSFFSRLRAAGEKAEAERKERAPHLNPRDEHAIRDVLVALGISENVTIPENILMPQDIEEIDFSVVLPSNAYDTGQVDSFVYKTKASIAEYIKIIKQRNTDIAKIASAVDSLQIDLNNMKFQNEISNGVTIATSGDDRLENELTETKLQLKAVREQLAEVQSQDGGQLDRIEKLKDMVDARDHRILELEAQAKRLTAQLDGIYEDKNDEEPFSPNISADDVVSEDEFMLSNSASEQDSVAPDLGGLTREEESTRTIGMPDLDSFLFTPETTPTVDLGDTTFAADFEEQALPNLLGDES